MILPAFVNCPPVLTFPDSIASMFIGASVALRVAALEDATSVVAALSVAALEDATSVVAALSVAALEDATSVVV
ncbi:hypothetical protein, partial [Enterococcus faecalis]